jgi:hypothetical protein
VTAMPAASATSWPRKLPTALMLLTVAMAIGTLAVRFGPVSGLASASEDGDVAQVLAGLSLGTSYAVVGWLLATRRAENPLGWIFLVIGLSQVGESFVTLSAVYGLVVAPGSVPGADFMAWLSTWLWAPGFGLFVTFSVLLFPDGRLPSSRWRPVAALAVVAMLLLAVPTAIAAWSVRGADLIMGTIPPSEPANSLQFVGLVLIVVLAIASFASLVVRFRRADGLERRQLAWFTWAAVPAFTFVLLSGFVTYPQIVWLLGSLFIAPLLPAAIGIAILRYRLYEIDRIVSRTILYVLLSAVLAAAFIGAVLLLESVFSPLTGENTIAVATSTLVAAALFAPVRARLQRPVDRRFNRARYDADRTVAAFGERLRDQVDLSALRVELEELASTAMEPTTSGLWVRAPERRA